jgi:hypothetical protein
LPWEAYSFLTPTPSKTWDDLTIFSDDALFDLVKSLDKNGTVISTWTDNGKDT